MKWTRRKRKSILNKSTKDLLLHWGWYLLRRQLPLPPQDASPTSSWTFRKLQIYPFINWPYPLFSFPLNFSNSPSCCTPFHELLPALRMEICSYITKLTFPLDITTRRTKMPRLQFHRHRHHEHHHLHLEVSERLHFKKVSLQQQIAHLKPKSTNLRQRSKISEPDSQPGELLWQNWVRDSCFAISISAKTFVKKQRLFIVFG